MTVAQLLRVVLWMTGALLSFSAMAVSVRQLSRGGLSILRNPGGPQQHRLLILGALTILRPELRKAFSRTASG